MRLNYFIQHKFFKSMMLKAANAEIIKQVIENEDGDFFTGMIMSAVKYFADQSPEESSMMDYETTFVSIGDTKIARCKFTGNLPITPPDCSSILIAVTDKIYYFTVEHAMFGHYAFCRWDDDSHLNYGMIEADDPEQYASIIKGVLELN